MHVTGCPLCAVASQEGRIRDLSGRSNFGQLRMSGETGEIPVKGIEARWAFADPKTGTVARPVIVILIAPVNDDLLPPRALRM
jgi:hypothetical protein